MKFPKLQRLVLNVDPTHVQVILEGEDGEKILYTSTVKDAWQVQEFDRAMGRPQIETVRAIPVSPDLSVTLLFLLYPSDRLREIWQLSDDLKAKDKDP